MSYVDTMNRTGQDKECVRNSIGDNVHIPSPSVIDVLKDKEKALRYNQGKAKWSMVHFKSLEPMVRVLMYGADKYARDNWKKGLDRQEILDSMTRHLGALIDGQEVDPESGEHHIGHILCNCMFYSYFNIPGEVIVPK